MKILTLFIHLSPEEFNELQSVHEDVKEAVYKLSRTAISNEVETIKREKLDRELQEVKL